MHLWYTRLSNPAFQQSYIDLINGIHRQSIRNLVACASLLLSGLFDRPAPCRQKSVPDQECIAHLNYFTDDEALLSIDEDSVNALHWPGDMTARILSEAFFHALHGIFDSIDRQNFLFKLHQFPRNQRSLTWDQRRWLAVTNLMWATGSKWLRCTLLDDDSGIENHLVYYARSRALGLDHRVIPDLAAMGSIMSTGLLSFYLFTNGSITRYGWYSGAER